MPRAKKTYVLWVIAAVFSASFLAHYGRKIASGDISSLLLFGLFFFAFAICAVVAVYWRSRSQTEDSSSEQPTLDKIKMGGNDDKSKKTN